MNFGSLRSLRHAALVAAILLPGSAAAQPYPSQPIRIIVPNPAGGLPDTLSRIVGKRLQERIGQPVVIENRPGANAGIGTAALTASAPDGYTFIMTDGAVLSISPLIYHKLPYNPKDMMPVSFVATAPIWLAANQKVPVTNMKEFAAYAKSKGGQADLRHLGCRQLPSSLDGSGAVRARREAHAGAVQGLRRLGDGSARRPHRFRVLVLRLALGRRRDQARDADRLERRQARQAHAQPADDRGDHSGLQFRGEPGPVRARWDPARDRAARSRARSP